MAYALAVLIGVAFGVGDQYLGSLAVGVWTISVSQLSAPWLVLPFMVGCSQQRAGRAAALGLLATLSALAGYFLMIMGPFEGGHWQLTLQEMHGIYASNRLVIAGAFLTGPLYAWLGQLWRTRRAWLSALAVAGALCLEPFVLLATGRTYPGRGVVWPIEIAVGVLLAAFFFVSRLGYRRRAGSEL